MQPYSGRWRAWRRIDTGHAGRLHSRKRARGHVQPRCRGGGNMGGEKCAAAGTAAAAARPRRATPTGGAFTPPRSAPLTAPLDGRPTGLRNRSRRACTITRGSSRARSTPVVTARGRRAHLGAVGGVVGGQAPSGPGDPCGRTVLFSNVTLLAFCVIATLPTSTRPQIPEDSNADCHL